MDSHSIAQQTNMEEIKQNECEEKKFKCIWIVFVLK